MMPPFKSQWRPRLVFGLAGLPLLGGLVESLEGVTSVGSAGIASSASSGASADLDAILLPLGYDRCVSGGPCSACSKQELLDDVAYCALTWQREPLLCAHCGFYMGSAGFILDGTEQEEAPRELPPPRDVPQNLLRVCGADAPAAIWIAHNASDNLAFSSSVSNDSTVEEFFRSCGRPANSAPESTADITDTALVDEDMLIDSGADDEDPAAVVVADPSLAASADGRPPTDSSIDALNDASTVLGEANEPRKQRSSASRSGGRSREDGHKLSHHGTGVASEGDDVPKLTPEEAPPVREADESGALFSFWSFNLLIFLISGRSLQRQLQAQTDEALERLGLGQSGGKKGGGDDELEDTAQGSSLSRSGRRSCHGPTANNGNGAASRMSSPPCDLEAGDHPLSNPFGHTPRRDRSTLAPVTIGQSIGSVAQAVSCGDGTSIATAVARTSTAIELAILGDGSRTSKQK